jgi:hypothetical protein
LRLRLLGRLIGIALVPGILGVVLAPHRLASLLRARSRSPMCHLV